MKGDRVRTPFGLQAGALGALLCVAGCTVPVASGLDEGEANEVLLRLDRASVDATKESDPENEGKFRVTILRDDTPAAVEALHAEGLPRARPKGILESTNQGALLPGPESEHAQLQAGLAGEFERTLLGIDGVTLARVHLSLPRKAPFGGEKEAKATASVLVAQREGSVSREAVQRLVAGGVPGIAKEDVEVIFVPRAVGHESTRALAHVGPIAVASGSRTLLQAVLGAMFGLLMALASVLLVREMRASRRIRELEAPKPRG